MKKWCSKSVNLCTISAFRSPRLHGWYNLNDSPLWFCLTSSSPRYSIPFIPDAPTTCDRRRSLHLSLPSMLQCNKQAKWIFQLTVTAVSLKAYVLCYVLNMNLTVLQTAVKESNHEVISISSRGSPSALRPQKLVFSFTNSNLNPYPANVENRASS
jgi:hypothetical protein